MGLGVKSGNFLKLFEKARSLLFIGKTFWSDGQESSDPTAEKARRGGGSHEGYACEGAAGGLWLDRSSDPMREARGFCEGSDTREKARVGSSLDHFG